MKRPFHTILVAFLAAWMPFCCCQARAAVHAMVHSTLDGVAPAPHACCQDEGTAADESSEDGCGSAEDEACVDRCCGGAASSHDTAHKPAKAPQQGCGTCKDRVLPGGSFQLEPAGDDCQWLIFALQASGALAACEPAPACPTICRTGPPGPQSGRDVLQQSGLLLV
ncbi:MAG: hypothetical protein U0636_09565 [Phycisphaerales bacterium]